jgi:hypothetical protein
MNRQEDPRDILSRESLAVLGSTMHIPVEEAAVCLMTESFSTLRANTLLTGAVELANIVGIGIVRDHLTISEGVALLNKVVDIFETLPEDTVSLWLSGRDDRDLAIQRDFVNLKRMNSPEHDLEVDAVLDRFRECIRSKIKDPEFDIIADATSYRAPTYLAFTIDELD